MDAPAPPIDEVLAQMRRHASAGYLADPFTVGTWLLAVERALAAVTSKAEANE